MAWASGDVAVAVPVVPETLTGFGDPGSGGTKVPLESSQVPLESGVSCVGEHRKNVTVPVGVGAVPPPLVWPTTVAVSVIELRSPSVRSAFEDGAVVIDTVHSPSLPRA